MVGVVEGVPVVVLVLVRVVVDVEVVGIEGGT